MVPPVGIEPTSSGLQPGAMTTSAKAANFLVLRDGLEPPSPDYKTGILAFEITEHCLVCVAGFEPTAS